MEDRGCRTNRSGNKNKTYKRDGSGRTGRTTKTQRTQEFIYLQQVGKIERGEEETIARR